jgi:phosphatidylcholine synthase
VHLYTASGAALALLIVLAAVQGETVAALWLGLVTLVVDGTDGMLARRFHVKEHMPWVDGARLDDIVDYLTYAFAPMVLLWTGGYLPNGAAGTALAMLPLIASGYGFCRVDAKTDDHCFLGFPSYWNVVAFYVIVCRLNTVVVTVILITCSLLVFVPIRYLYPSRTLLMRRTNIALTGVWLLLYALILLGMPNPATLLVAASVAYLVYYLAVSLMLTARQHRGGGSSRSGSTSAHVAAASAGS